MLNWNVVLDCNDENDNPTCWSALINHGEYGKYIYITINSNNKYDVEIEKHGDFKVLVTCNSLTSAKRWVSTYIK